MPFEWYQGDPPGPSPEKFRAQYVNGIRERARLLCNLGFTEERAVSRIRAAIEWEFDASLASTPLPAFHAEIPALVGEVFAYAGRGRAPQKPAKKAKKAKAPRKKTSRKASK